MNLDMSDDFKVSSKQDDFLPNSPKNIEEGARGVIEFIIKDKRGNVLNRWFEPNIIKIFAKEMLAHRMPSTEVWDPEAGGGSGAWIDSGRDPNEEFSARYILFGASFDDSGLPLDVDDDRFYTTDPVTGSRIPIRLGPGAEFNGGLINAVPFSEPTRPLKRVEQVSFQATYQPTGSPLLQSDVRAMNNIVALQTTLKLDEYNGLGITDSDFFTLTEVALVGGRKIDTVGDCECTPRDLFLQGVSDGSSLSCVANCSDVISISSAETEIDLIKEGDQIKIVGPDDSAGAQTINQISPFYLVIAKAVGGRDIQLDRTPVDTDNNPIKGDIGVFRDTLRVFSHRILKSPVKKSADFEIDIVWRIVYN